MTERTIKGDNFTMTENRPEWLVRAENRQLFFGSLGLMGWTFAAILVFGALINGAYRLSIANGSPTAKPEAAMSERFIHVGDWNAQGLLPVEIADHTEEGSTVRLLRFTPEEARELEHKLHEANAERDE